MELRKYGIANDVGNVTTPANHVIDWLQEVNGLPVHKAKLHDGRVVTIGGSGGGGGDYDDSELRGRIEILESEMDAVQGEINGADEALTAIEGVI